MDRLSRWSPQVLADWLGRSLLIGLAYPLVLTMTDWLGRLVGLPAPTIAGQAEPWLLPLANILIGTGSALVLGPLGRRLSLNLAGRTLAMTALLFGVGTVINLIEALFFTTSITQADLLMLPSLLVGQTLIGLLLASLFPPTGPQPGLLAAARARLYQRHWASWAGRLLLAGLLYVPTYFLFGGLIAPIVLPAYQAVGSNLTIPAPEVILALETGRGLLFLLVVLPIVVGWRGATWSLAAWLGLVIAVLGGWLPLLTVGLLQTQFQLPLLLRIVHGVEITADAVVQGLTIAWLLVGGLDGRLQYADGRATNQPAPLGTGTGSKTPASQHSHRASRS